MKDSAVVDIPFQSRNGVELAANSGTWLSFKSSAKRRRP
jgi:hypothetical protein